jgi:glycosyltransferase involved in cell wall biosynthesis
MKAEISVILSVFNNEKYLKAAIDSILSQTYSDFELLIMNDGSTDKSQKIINSYNDKRIRMFRNKKRQGLAWCLNYLIRKASGKLIARMDGDDIAYKNRLKEQYNFFKLNPEFVLVGGWAKIINRKGRIIGKLTPLLKYKEIKRNIISNNHFIHPAVMFRKKIFKKIGGYDKSLFYSQDYDLFLRMVAKYPCANINKYLIKFRWRPDFDKQKIQHKTALKLRIKAISQYGYPKIQLIKLIKPLVFYLIPSFIKKIFWELKFQ